MKTFLGAATAACVLLTTPATAAPGENAPEHAAANSPRAQYERSGDPDCFGRARAFFAQLYAEYDTPHGSAISERGGDNAEMNAAWIERSCH